MLGSTAQCKPLSGQQCTQTKAAGNGIVTTMGAFKISNSAEFLTSFVWLKMYQRVFNGIESILNDCNKDFISKKWKYYSKKSGLSLSVRNEEFLWFENKSLQNRFLNKMNDETIEAIKVSIYVSSRFRTFWKGLPSRPG